MADASMKLLDSKKAGPLVLVGSQHGVTVIPTPTPLTRLNYFDGKFLRADDLTAEQSYLRRLVELSNRAGGPGVAHGFDLTLGTGDTLTLGPGLAIDPVGRVLLLPQDVAINIQDLIEKSQELRPLSAKANGKPVTGFAECTLTSEAAPTDIAKGSDLYVIMIAHAEALCGAEDVYGKLCEEACVTSTDRPYRIEGVAVRALPLLLKTPLALSKAVALNRAHLRSLVASAYYADERTFIASLISRAGLQTDVWCFGAEAASSNAVPIGVIARAGTSTVFLDAWTARRERIDPTAKRYWQWRMAMRPWDVYLAHILQFQCQLHELFLKAPEPGGTDDPCRQERDLIHEASETVTHLLKFYQEVSEKLAVGTRTGALTVNPELTKLIKEGLGKGGLTHATAMHEKLLATKKALSLAAVQRLLIRGGIVELPSAGYLPVVPGTVTINKQVRALLGEGVDLRFCVVRPDFVPHALEEAQHMERISLLQGLDDPQQKPEVDVLVPNGEIVTSDQGLSGRGFEGRLALLPTQLDIRNVVTPYKAPLALAGAGRSEVFESGGGAFHFAGAAQVKRAVMTELAAGLVHVGTTTTDHLTRLTSVAGSPDAAPVSATLAHIDPRVLTTLIGAGNRANRFRASILAAAGTGTEATIRPFDPQVTGNTRLVSFWTTMRCAQNPFAMEAHDTTSVALRTILDMPGGDVELHLNLQGEFRVDQAATGFGETRKVLGRLLLFGSMQGNGPNANIERTSPLDIEAVLTLTARAGQDAVVEITLRYQNRVEFTLRTQWSSGPILSKTQVTYTVGTRTIELLRAELQENDDVLLPTNTLHTLALSTLQLIGASLKDPGFEAGAAKLLFPPPPPPTEEISVRGTLDWVLFHRRRNKHCAIVEEKPQVLARRYQAYQVEPKDQEAVQALRSALLRADVPKPGDLGLKTVSQVVFGPGVATLLSSPEAVVEDWKKVQPGTHIIHGFIATHGPGDGDPLAVQRLGHLEEALVSVSPLDPGVEQPNEVMPKVSETMNVAGTDGVIVLVTRTATTCHSVYALIPGASLGRVIAEDGHIREEVLQAQDVVKKLDGDVSFKAGTTQVVSENGLQPVVTAWEAHAQGNQVGEVVVVSRKGEPAAAVAAYLEQAQAIAVALGATQAVPRSIESPVDLPGDCPAITFITVQPQVRVGRILVWGSGEPGNRDLRPLRFVLLVNFAADGSLLEGLADPVVNELRRFGRFFMVEVAPQDDPPDARAEKRLDAIIRALAEKQLVDPNLRERSVVALKGREPELLTEGGITATDLIFLRVG